MAVTIRKFRGPKAYICEHPKHDTVRLMGRYIHIKKLAKREGLEHSYLSKILSGDRTPAITYLQRIARALDMTIDDLMEAISDRKKLLQAQRLKRAG